MSFKDKGIYLGNYFQFRESSKELLFPHTHISPFTELPKLDNSGGKLQSCLHALRKIHRAHSECSHIVSKCSIWPYKKLGIPAQIKESS